MNHNAVLEQCKERICESKSIEVILSAVQTGVLFLSPFQRPARFQRHSGNFQQSRDLSIASIQTVRSIG